MEEISVYGLVELINNKEKFRLIDVREPAEYTQANIGGELIPLATLPDALGNLDSDERIVVMCRSGARSGTAASYMEQMGFTNVANLKGGILAYKAEIDPSINAT